MAASAPIAAPAAPTTVRVNFTSNPAGAVVVRADTGKELGETPLEAEIPYGDSAVEFVFKKEGYDNKVAFVVPNLPAPLFAMLQPVAKPAGAKTEPVVAAAQPAAKPMPAAATPSSSPKKPKKRPPSACRSSTTTRSSNRRSNRAPHRVPMTPRGGSWPSGPFAPSAGRRLG